MPHIVNLTNYLAAIQSSGLLILIKIIFVLLTLIFIIAIGYFLRESGYLQIRLFQDVSEFFNFKPYGTAQINKKWQKVRNRLELQSDAEYKLAIIDAEDILDGVLGRLGYKGETLGDKLRILTPAQLSNLDKLLEAHQIRNNIVYDPDYRFSLDRAQRILEVYEKVLQDLQAL